MKLVVFGLMSCDRLCYVFPTFWFVLSLPLAHPQTPHSNAQGTRNLPKKTMCDQHCHIGTIWEKASHLELDALDFDVSQVRRANPADLVVKVLGVFIDRIGFHFLHVVQSDVTDCQNLVRRPHDRTRTIRQDEAAHLRLDVADIRIFRVIEARRDDLNAEVPDNTVDRIVRHFLLVVQNDDVNTQKSARSQHDTTVAIVQDGATLQRHDVAQLH